MNTHIHTYILLLILKHMGRNLTKQRKIDSKKSSKNYSVHLDVINADSHLQSQTNFSPTKQIKSNSYIG